MKSSATAANATTQRRMTRSWSTHAPHLGPRWRMAGWLVKRIDESWFRRRPSFQAAPFGPLAAPACEGEGDPAGQNMTELPDTPAGPGAFDAFTIGHSNHPID